MIVVIELNGFSPKHFFNHKYEKHSISAHRTIIQFIQFILKSSLSLQSNRFSISAMFRFSIRRS